MLIHNAVITGSLLVSGSIAQNTILSSLLKANASGQIVPAIPGVDYVSEAVASISGSLNYVPKFDGSGSIIESNIIDTGTGIGLYTSSADYEVHMKKAGNARYFVETTTSSGLAYHGAASNGAALQLAAFGSSYASPWTGLAGIYISNSPTFWPNKSFNIWRGPTQLLKITDDANNSLLVGPSDTTTGERLQVQGSIKQTGVTSALLKANSTGVLVAAVAGTDYQAPVANAVSGTGLTNFVAKFNGTGSITTGSIYDDGLGVGIGTTSPAAPLEVIAGTFGNYGIKVTDSVDEGYIVISDKEIDSATVSGSPKAICIQYNSTGSTIINALGGSTLIGKTSSDGAKLQVQGNQTITGSLFVTSNVTAACFIGNGAGLTNLPSTGGPPVFSYTGSANTSIQPTSGSSTSNGTYSTISGGSCSVTNSRYSVIGGGHRNTIQSPTNECCSKGVTISGGIGHNSSGGTICVETGDISGAITCCNAGEYSVISGGYRNCALGDTSTIGGGINNTTNGCCAVIGGGSNNTAGLSSTCPGSTVGGGLSNCSFGFAATVAGGQNNRACNFHAAIAGGDNNFANGGAIFGAAAVAGGSNNTASSGRATVGGGFLNTASGFASTIGGGQCHTASGGCSTISGGYCNTACVTGATVGGGACNRATGTTTFVGGGCRNCAIGACSFVGGGAGGTVLGVPVGNRACAALSAIVGGFQNLICSTGGMTAIGGGGCNTASGCASTISGGYNNVITAAGVCAVIGGGQNNFASCTYATVAGGVENYACGQASVVGGGQANIACEAYATVAGGYCNQALGLNSFIGAGICNKICYVTDPVFFSPIYTNNTISGGYRNCTEGISVSATIGGGCGNRILQPQNILGVGNTISGGYCNTNSGYCANTISGGSYNTVCLGGTCYNTIVGGTNNRIESGTNCSIIAGSNIIASVSGYLYVNNFCYYTPSDSRLKRGISPITYGLSEVSKLQPVSYCFKKDVNNTKRYGFLAQCVQEAMPGVVDLHPIDLVEGEPVLTLDKEAIWASMVNAIKELKERVEELEAKLNT